MQPEPEHLPAPRSPQPGEWRAAWLVAGVGLLAGLPMILRGFWPAVHDAQFHSVWYVNFSRQLWAGEFYPRWLMDSNGGLGSPAFFYYPPVPYYCTSLFRPFFGSDPAGWHQLGAGAALALILSGLTCWLWLRRLTSPLPALAGALAYMLAPYHLATDLYVRGAYAELWAFAWLPLILLGLERLKRRERGGVPLLAASYALLIATHLPTTLLCSLVPPVYAWLVPDKTQRRHTLGLAILGMVWGMAMAAAYLIPAMTMQGHVSMEALTNHPYLKFENNFLLTALHPKADAFKAAVFWQIAAIFGLGICGFIIGSRTSQPPMRRQLWFWFGVLYAALFLMLPLSAPLWENVPKLRLVQFPWRAVTLLSLAASVLLALAWHCHPRPLAGMERGFAVVAAVLLAVWGWLDCQAIRPFWRAVPALESSVMARQEDALEYRPRWVSKSPEEILAALDVNRQARQVDKFVDGELPLLPRAVVNDRARLAVAFELGTGTISLDEWRPRQITLQVQSHTNCRLKIARFYYPGWKTTLNLKALAVGPSLPDGLLQVDLPSGRHTLRLALTRTPPEIAGLSLSGGAITVWIGTLLMSRKRHAKNV